MSLIDKGIILKNFLEKNILDKEKLNLGGAEMTCCVDIGPVGNLFIDIIGPECLTIPIWGWTFLKIYILCL